jgi:hypothetical protein
MARCSSVVRSAKDTKFSVFAKNLTSKQKNSAYSFPYALFYQDYSVLSIIEGVVLYERLLVVFLATLIDFIQP